MSSTVTRSYDSYANAKTVVSELKAADFKDSEISLVAHKDAEGGINGTATGAGLGAVAGGTVGLLTGIGIMAIPGVGPVVAAGWLVATAVGAVAGGAAGAATGGIIDALVHSGVSKEDAHVYGETVRRGGTLVSVQTDNGTRRATAADIMDRAHPVDISTRRTAYESQGWKAFDPEAKPYTSEETETERRRYL
jgi:hypothetical protein